MLVIASSNCSRVTYLTAYFDFQFLHLGFGKFISALFRLF